MDGVMNSVSAGSVMYKIADNIESGWMCLWCFSPVSDRLSQLCVIASSGIVSVLQWSLERASLMQFMTH